jgi:hypothetical protein
MNKSSLQLRDGFGVGAKMTYGMPEECLLLLHQAYRSVQALHTLYADKK